MNLSPATGTSVKPIMATGVDGPADFNSARYSFVILRTRPYAAPTTTKSPAFNVPFCTNKVALAPSPLSRRASNTVPKA